MFGRGATNCCVYLLLMFAALVTCPVKAAKGKGAHFELKPNSCIAMSKGKDCYGNLVLSWTLQSPRNVCLYQEQRERPIFCWSKRLTGEYSGPFVLSRSSKYSLVDVENEEVLFTDSIAVTWVYKESRKRRRWRLF
jgi:hypothetical protein